MNQIPEKEDDKPSATGKPAQPGQAPREIPREEMDHGQPADADPDDPVTP